MHTFDPALMAEIAYRREDIRRSFRSTRRVGRTTVTGRATPGPLARRSVPVVGTVTHRAA